MNGVPVRAEERLMIEKSAVRVEENDHCSSWVVEMEKKLVDTDPSVEMARWKKPSIYQVPDWIKDTNRKAYRPLLVSLGPFHHGAPGLVPMEGHKQRAVLHQVKRAEKSISDLVATIEEVVDELQSAYDYLGEEWRGPKRSRFVEMMITDGCFLLEIAIMPNISVENSQVLEDYAPNDPVFSEHGCLHLLPDICSDVLLMENQLPLLVLQRLSDVLLAEPLSGETINISMLRFLGRPTTLEGISDLALHPLDLFHKSFRGPRADRQTLTPQEQTTPSATELRKAGIHFRVSDTLCVCDISFEDGVLSLPPLSVDDGTENNFLNLMAYERLHPDAGNDVIDYIFLMDNIIDTERDVELLRSKGVIENLLGSNKEAAALFNTLSKGAVMSPYSKLGHVHWKVNVHCRKPWNKWRANFVQTYLSTPWVFISLVAATILLGATLLQTVYAIMQFYTKS